MRSDILSRMMEREFTPFDESEDFFTKRLGDTFMPFSGDSPFLTVEGGLNGYACSELFEIPGLGDVYVGIENDFKLQRESEEFYEGSIPVVPIVVIDFRGTTLFRKNFLCILGILGRLYKSNYQYDGGDDVDYLTFTEWTYDGMPDKPRMNSLEEIVTSTLSIKVLE